MKEGRKEEGRKKEGRRKEEGRKKEGRRKEEGRNNLKIALGFLTQLLFDICIINGDLKI